MSKPRQTTKWLMAALALQAVVLLSVGHAEPATAQGIPDAGAQMQQLIDQAKATNAKLDRLITLLGEGKLEVSLRKTDDANRNR